MPFSSRDQARFFSSDWCALLALSGLLFVFYPALFFAKSASLLGDHWEQHYPWAVLMWDALRHGQLPFWTPLIQCGFPIAAESQIGIFYLPNLFLYALLPIRWAYAYMNLFHFFVSGAGTYFYARKIGIKPAGAFMATIVFVFGAGYGGAYYNLTSLKTIAWFPWILWGFEKFSERFRLRYLLSVGFGMSLALVAGYLQVAALMISICFVYFALRTFFFSPPEDPWKKKIKLTVGMMVAGALALLLSFPQLGMTFELALFSSRVSLSEDYAYVGSLSPLVLLTVLFPKLQGLFHGSCLYSGIVAIYFAEAAFFASDVKVRRMVWLWGAMTAISWFLALGQWSPLYVALIKLTHFYAFRIPAKFLIFICFGFSVLAGFGVHVWHEELTKPGGRLGPLNRSYLWTVTGLMAVWAGVYVSVSIARSQLIALGQWVIEHFIYGRSGHPRSLDSYLESVVGLIDTARHMLSLNNPWQIWALALVAFSCVWIWAVPRIVARPFGPLRCLAVAMAVLFIELYVFAGDDIKRDFDTYQNVLKPNPIVQALLAEKEAGRLGRLYSFRKEVDKPPVIPSVNMLYGIEDIGGYSPFIMRRYFETIGQFGNVNDSNRMQEPDLGFVLERLPLLRVLDVSHIQSMTEISRPDFELLARDAGAGAYLYRIRGERVRGYFVPAAVRFDEWPTIKQALMSPGFDPRSVLWLENSEKSKIQNPLGDKNSKAEKILRVRHESNREVWEFETTGSGFFIVTNVMYPGWEAVLDGRKVPILGAYGLFQTVRIPREGKHVLELNYKPYRALWQKMRGNAD